MFLVDIDRDPVTLVEHDLEKEFYPQLSHEVIVRLAEEEVSSFEDARIGDYLPLLAWRKARRRAQLMLAPSPA